MLRPPDNGTTYTLVRVADGWAVTCSCGNYRIVHRDEDEKLEPLHQVLTLHGCQGAGDVASLADAGYALLEELALPLGAQSPVEVLRLRGELLQALAPVSGLRTKGIYQGA